MTFGTAGRAALPRFSATASDPREGPHLVSGRAYPWLLAASILLLLVAVAAATVVGSVGLPLATVVDSIGSRVGLAKAPNPVDDAIVWELRLPRVLLAAVSGAGLALAGAVLQTVIRNPLADPYVLGVASGASLGAVAVLTLGNAALQGLGLSGAAFLGAAATLVLVLAMGRRGGQLVPTRLVLAGVAVGYLLQSATSFLQLRAAPGELSAVLFWLLGSVAGAQWDQLALPAAAVAVSAVWLQFRSRSLDALLLGDEAAVSLGVPVHGLRLQLLTVSAVLTGLIIAVSGGIGFVGLVVPHAVRLLVGPAHRLLLPLCVTVGAGFLVLVDLAARTVDRPAELPLGVLTAALGAPLFLWLLHRSSAGRST